MAKYPQKSSNKPVDQVITPVRDFRETQPGNALATPVAPPLPQKAEKAPLKYDWLSIPRGMFNLTDAGVEFRDEEGGLRNKALALQYRGLLESGYRLHSFVPNGGEVFLVFEKA